MYVLGGDQTVAMQVVAGTPVETAMADAYARGAVFGGNSAGDAVQSRNMINGYTEGNGYTESLRKGALDVWTDDGAGDLPEASSSGCRTSSRTSTCSSTAAPAARSTSRLRTACRCWAWTRLPAAC